MAEGGEGASPPISRSSGHRLGEGVVFSLGRFSCLAFKAEKTSPGTRRDVGSFLGVGIPPAPEGEALPLGRRVGAGVPVGTAFLPRLRGRRGERRDKISPGA
jgi:hypothetical protein